MANGHIPGRVNPANPYEQIGQTLSQRQHQGMQAIQQLLAGQTPGVPGLPAGGWSPDFRSLQQFASAALSALQDDPTMDLSAFEAAFIQPLLSSTVPAQLLALDYYTRKAGLTQDLGAFPFAQLPGGSISAIRAQSQVLGRLGEEFAHDPRFQQMLGQFVSAHVPTGQASVLPTNVLSAVASPYFQQLFQFGGDTTAAGLPQIAWPTSTAGTPIQRQNVIEAIAQAALGTQGQEVTPFGLQAETQTSALGRLIDQGLDALRALPGFNFGQPQGTPPTGFPVGTGAPIDSAVGMATPESLAALAAQAGQADQIAQADQAVQPGPPPASSGQMDRSPSAIVQAIKNQLSQMGADASWTIMQLMTNRNQLMAAVGDEGWRDLMIWAQMNLPRTPGWSPPWGADPIQAAINVLNSRR